MPQVVLQSRNSDAESKACFCLRPAAVVAACFLLAAAVVLAYLGGVMSGRASWRSQALQAQAARQAAPEDAAAGDKDAKQADAEQGAGQGILAPEDLRFARVLRGESLPPAKTAPVAAAAAQAVVPAGPKSAGRESAPGQTAAQTAAPGGTGQGAAAVQATSPAPAAFAASAQPTPGAMSDYVFQVGAFKDADSVDGLRQRLEGRGLRTRMERSGKLYVVLVLLRGDQARAAEVVHTAESMGLGKPIQRSRKPVPVQN
ncbi:SPOR domain-containing protein [Desulfovibrio legallii]|uniref:SPOR domain-containing protein n=1 Tax=Desulfovibrio legallii TaxID=571438 RepID=A0A6H3FFI9_9BACT|nr:SPOR domain-containing protein [Desulfovibrio legallii]RHH23385.1 SPOR domain-containing protein [Desulfovibrio sp. AM18-2]TBH81098.1 SPOR domain-containing protein [Desulfovibrio legallii]CAI3229565.1 hypothetical protein DWUX_1044 [Desulfovibrio diazotrophicus]